METEIVRNGAFTFEEANRYFNGKIPVTPEEFKNLADHYKTLAFTISGYTQLEIIHQFYRELSDALEQGTTQEQFQENINGFLERKGYKGISPNQADNIFRTNIQTAYQVGHYRQMTSATMLRIRPFWQYHAVHDDATRPEHLAMDGKVYPADHPVWDVWYPPNGYRCRCNVTTLSKRQVENRQLPVESDAPEDQPDKGFASNPAKTPFEPDYSGFPPAFRKAAEIYKGK